MKRALGDSNEYSEVPPKKEKSRSDSQSGDSFGDDDASADGSFDNDEYDDELDDEYDDEYDDEDDEEELEEDGGGDNSGSKTDNRPMCKYGAACYRTNPNHLADFQHPPKTGYALNVAQPLSAKKSPAKTPKKTPKKKPISFGAPPVHQYTGPRVVPPEFLAKSATMGVGWTMFALQKSAGNPKDPKNATDAQNSTSTTTADVQTTTPTVADTTNTTSPTKGENKTAYTKNTPTSKTKEKKTPKKGKGAKNSSPAKTAPANDSNTDSSSSPSTTFQPLSAAEIETLFEPYPELQTKLDRTGSVPVTKFLKMTALNGLPLFQTSNPSFNKELVHCINYIFWRVKKEEDKDKKKESIFYLADAYQSCQAVQATAILSTYSKLTNVDMTFQDQVRNLVDDFKGRNLDQLVLTIHPNANIVPDSNPAGQAPHIRSAYLLILDRNGVDLPGKQVAIMDHAQPHPPPPEIQNVVSTWPTLFSVDTFISEFVGEINQGANAKFIDHSKFYQWVNQLDDKAGFDKHSVFYNEENKDDYDAPQKEEDQLVLPYLSKKVAAEVLCCMESRCGGTLWYG
eukprot:Phypoly_transcript_05338.p1 GENE.Phypoly_transcript_05338~~Phypoly_transcript_05338.p1  ORF type:complete len:576 (+),score=137.91 Phypoly_transcript_05338:25-1728(+)